MEITFDGSELNRLAADMRNKTGAVGGMAAAAVKKTAFAIEGTAKSIVPVDTGNLRNSITTTITGDGRFSGISAEIGPTVEYGVYVETGTSTQAPASYMGPAFDRHAHQLETALLKLADLGI